MQMDLNDIVNIFTSMIQIDTVRIKEPSSEF